MIRPTKYLKLDCCLLNVAAHIIDALKPQGAMKYDALLKQVVFFTGQQSEHEFPTAIGFLFLLGRLEYIASTDSIVLLEAKSVPTETNK